MPISQFVTLNTGAHMPTIGLGTWRSEPGVVEKAVEFALKHGYRHIDTATAYRNEKEVGDGIRASGVPRNEIFLTTKLNTPDMKNPERALEYSLQQLQTPYLDLWLMHWPAPMTSDDDDGEADRTIDWLDTWKTMETLYKAHPDKLKAIGVSNFSVEYLERLLGDVKVIPAVNQIELHPSCVQQDVVDLCTKKGIALTAYSPLGSNKAPLLEFEVVERIANKRGVHPANVLISLQANRPNVTVIPKSVTNERILLNLTLIDLSAEEIEELHEIEKTRQFRACHPSWTGWGHLGFPDCK